MICKELKYFLTDGVILRKEDWFWCYTLTVVLLTIPCLFGFITALLTPKVGISCRALTFLVYWCTQVALLTLWGHRSTRQDESWKWGQQIKESFKQNTESTTNLVTRLAKQVSIKFGIQIPGITDSSNAQKQPTSETTLHKILTALFWVATVLALFGAVFSSFAGSVLQLVGVYRNCFCQMGASSWTSPNRDNVFILVSTNSAEAIDNAKRYWIPIGAASTGFLGFVCYVGWLYQIYFRKRFNKLADQLGRTEV